MGFIDGFNTGLVYKAFGRCDGEIGAADLIGAGCDQGIKNLNTACERGLKRSCDALVGIMDRECQRGNADACTILGGWVLRGKNGLETNVQRGVGLLRKGCQMGDKDACDVLHQLNVPE